MEKITGYTKAPWSYGLKKLAINPMDENTQYETKRGYYFIKAGAGVHSVDGFEITAYINEPDAHMLSLAPTLYEQHFKMLEALRRVLKINAVAREHINESLFEEIEQTIKECEL